MTPDTAEHVWYVVDDHTVVQSWTNPDRGRTEYVQYETTKRVDPERLRTADSDYLRMMSVGSWYIVLLAALSLVALVGIMVGGLLLPSLLDATSDIPVTVLLVSAVALPVLVLLQVVYGVSRRRTTTRFIADLGFDHRTGHTLKTRQVEELMHAPGTVTVRPTL